MYYKYITVNIHEVKDMELDSSEEFSVGFSQL
jgi:hypothetical protein